MAKSAKEAKAQRWRIILARVKGVYLGTVEARDAESAVGAGAKEFGYPKWRLIAEAME